MFTFSSEQIMKKFLVKTGFFLSAQLLLVLLFEIIISTNRTKVFLEKNLEKNYEAESFKYKWINFVYADSIILLAGSSSVKYGLSCSILNELSDNNVKYVNIANEARDPIQTYFILTNMYLNRVSTIYYGLDPWIYTKKYYKYRPSYIYLDFSFFDILQYTREHDISALYKRNKSFFKFIFPENKKMIKNDDRSIPPDFGSATLEKKPKNFDQAINEVFQIKKYGWSDLQFIYLKKIAVFCEERKIKFAVFIPPKRSDFTRIYRQKCGAVHRDYISKLTDIGLNVPVFGRFDQLEDIGDSVYFVDAYHLNPLGQKKYSGIFDEMTKKEMKLFDENYKWFK